MEQYAQHACELSQSRSDAQNDEELVLNEDLRRLQSVIVPWEQQFLVKHPSRAECRCQV